MTLLVFFLILEGNRGWVAWFAGRSSVERSIFIEKQVNSIGPRRGDAFDFGFWGLVGLGIRLTLIKRAIDYDFKWAREVGRRIGCLL